MLPPGAERLATSPAPTGSAAIANTMGMSLVTCFATANARSTLPANYDAYNNQFHSLILRLSGNGYVAGVLDHTRLPIFRLQFNKLLLQPEQIAQSRADHNRIAKEISK